MNDRIRELAEQTNSQHDNFFDLNYKELDVFLEKFAELILTEVTDILSTYRGKIIFVDGFEYNCEHPIIAIRKHFGVE
jgi:hypothetical protein